MLKEAVGKDKAVARILTEALERDDTSFNHRRMENYKMQKVYDIMNAVQFSIMADRFEELAVRIATLQPSEDL